MRMEWLMARVSLQIAAATTDPKKPLPKFASFIRYHNDDDEEPKDVSAEMQARMFANMMNAGKT